MAGSLPVPFLPWAFDEDTYHRVIRILQDFLAQTSKELVGLGGGGGGGGAPKGATYLVGSADATLTNEIVVGLSPGGELSGSWGAPTVNVTHSGSAHHAEDHVLATGTALGVHHTISGAAAGEVLRALSGTTAAFDQLAFADLAGSLGSSQHRVIGSGDLHPEYAIDAEFADHNARHEPGGGDPMAVDAAAATGSLRTLGTGAAQAAAGTHTHSGASWTTGVTTVDFGAFPGSWDTTKDITGQAGIVAGSILQAWIRPVATADHNADEHWVDPPRIVAGNISPGTGFTIYGRPRDEELCNRPYGQWTVAWAWT